MDLKKIALIGAGSVGSVYSELLYNQHKDDFSVIADGKRSEKIKKNGLSVNGKVFFPNVVSASDNNYKADLIIFGVKNYHLSKALSDVKNSIKKETVLLPILNGVTARDEILKAFPDNKVLFGLTIGIDAVRKDDNVVSQYSGIIQFGNEKNDVISDEVAAIKGIFENSNINYEICTDMQRAIWKKFMINVGLNQVSAVGRVTYKGFCEIPEYHGLMQKAMLEVVKIAEALKINLTEEDVYDFDNLLVKFPKDSKTSMHQDAEAKRFSEVEYFSGTVIKYGKELNINTPVNDVLHDLIVGMEKAY